MTTKILGAIFAILIIATVAIQIPALITTETTVIETIAVENTTIVNDTIEINDTITLTEDELNAQFIEESRAKGHDVDNMTLLKYNGVWRLYTERDLLILFLHNDTTDQQTYTLGTHDCKMFSMELAENLTQAGYEAGILSINARSHGYGGHWMVWVELTNETIHIEPQNDCFGVLDKYTSGNHTIREITLDHAERNLAFFNRCK